LGNVLKALAFRAHAKGLELVCRIQPEIPHRIVGDSDRLRQVVVNLVGNAIKFTEEGQVVLEVFPESSSASDILLHFSVTDTGIGIPEDRQADVFGAFEQADNSTTREFGGSGLGLTISSKLVELMGGRIWLESRVGEGSTFHVTARFAQAAEKRESSEQAPLSGFTILVLDDNAANQEMLRELLATWAASVLVSSDTDVAAEQLRRRRDSGAPVNLALIDAHLRERDTFAFAQETREQQLADNVVMMLTCADLASEIDRCQAAGIASYVLKPISHSELLDVILTRLGLRQRGAMTSPSALAIAGQPLPPLRILLAEDSLVNQKLAAGLLEKAGHTVILARDGREAVAMWASQDLDAILMDVQMPEMDGFEATRVIRAQERNAPQRTPIIAMTAHAMKGDRERCLSAGMDDYLAKPVRAKELFAKLAAALDIDSSEQQNGNEPTDTQTVTDKND